MKECERFIKPSENKSLTDFLKEDETKTILQKGCMWVECPNCGEVLVLTKENFPPASNWCGCRTPREFEETFLERFVARFILKPLNKILGRFVK